MAEWEMFLYTSTNLPKFSVKNIISIIEGMLIASLSFGWWRRPPDMQGNCDYIE
jgi:hypothetical protein